MSDQNDQELEICHACGEKHLSTIQMEIDGFKICSNCYCTQIPWSKLQAVKREIFYRSRKLWADALKQAPQVELKPKCPIQGVDMKLLPIKEYGSTPAWQNPSEGVEVMILEPAVMADILEGSTQIREEFTSSKYRAKTKWNPLAFVGNLFAGKKDDDLDDMFEDIQFQRKIAPALGLKK